MEENNFRERFRELCKTRGLTMRDAAIRIGISPATITKWKHGSKPDVNTLQKIADFFQVPMNYIVGNEELPSVMLSEEEEELVLLYRKLDPKSRTAVMAMVRNLQDED